MLRLLASLLPVTLSGAAIPTAVAAPLVRAATGVPDSRLARDAEASWIAFELTPANQIRFAMLVNGVRAAAILDTGLSDTLVASDFARRAGLRASVRGDGTAIGGALPIRWASVKSLAVGPLSRTGGRVAVAELDSRALGGGAGADVLLGSDVLGCCALDIDYDRRRFRILASGRMPFRGTVAPLAMAPGQRAPVTEVRIDGRRVAPVIVDTGDGAALTLSKLAWGLAGPAGLRMSTTLGWGLGGPAATDVAILPGFALGPLRARRTEVRIEPEGGFSARVGAAGRIGTGFLQRYRVLLDPGARRMVLLPGAQAGAEPLRSTSGLLLRAAGTSFEVLHVMANSPAAGQWRTGERICEVDGVAVAGTGLPAWPVGQPGRVVALTLCGGEARTLTLRDFY